MNRAKVQRCHAAIKFWPGAQGLAPNHHGLVLVPQAGIDADKALADGGKARGVLLVNVIGDDDLGLVIGLARHLDPNLRACAQALFCYDSIGVVFPVCIQFQHLCAGRIAQLAGQGNAPAALVIIDQANSGKACVMQGIEMLPVKHVFPDPGYAGPNLALIDGGDGQAGGHVRPGQ